MERISNNRFIGAWKRAPSSTIKIVELSDLRICIDVMVFGSQPDIWMSKLSTNGTFTFMICRS